MKCRLVEDPKDQTGIACMNHGVRVTGRLKCEADPRHAELIAKGRDWEKPKRGGGTPATKVWVNAGDCDTWLTAQGTLAKHKFNEEV